MLCWVHFGRISCYLWLALHMGLIKNWGRPQICLRSNMRMINPDFFSFTNIFRPTRPNYICSFFQSLIMFLAIVYSTRHYTYLISCIYIYKYIHISMVRESSPIPRTPSSCASASERPRLMRFAGAEVSDKPEFFE